MMSSKERADREENFTAIGAPSTACFCSKNKHGESARGNKKQDEKERHAR